MRAKFKAYFNALGACASIYAIFELMRVISHYWHVVALPYPLTYLEFFFLAVGMTWIAAAVIDNLYLRADLLGIKLKTVENTLMELITKHYRTVFVKMARKAMKQQGG